MNDQIKMRSKQKSHLLPAMALLQLLLTALLVFAAGGGSYNLSVTDSSTNATLPIVATTNIVGTTNYITNYLAIDSAMTNALDFQIAPTNTLSNVTWNFSNAIQTPAGPLTGNSVMVTLNTANFPTNITPVTINSQRTDSSGAICSTAQTVVMLVPVQFRLLNGSTNTADVDGMDFSGSRPTTISGVTDDPLPLPPYNASPWTSTLASNLNDGLDIIGMNIPFGRGRSGGFSDIGSIEVLAKVAPASANVTYSWGRTYRDRSVTITKIAALTNNSWYVKSVNAPDLYPSGFPTPENDLGNPVGWDHTAVPTNNNILYDYDNPGLSINWFLVTSATNGYPIRVNDYVYEKIDYTYTMTNTIGTANTVALMHVGQIIIDQCTNNSTNITNNWQRITNSFSTTQIPNCKTITAKEISDIVGSTNIIFDANVTNYP